MLSRFIKYDDWKILPFQKNTINYINPKKFEKFKSFESNFHLHLRLCQNSSYYRHYLWQVVNWLDLTWVYQTLWLVHQIVQVYKKSTGTTFLILIILNFLKLCFTLTREFALPIKIWLRMMKSPNTGFLQFWLVQKTRQRKALPFWRWLLHQIFSRKILGWIILNFVIFFQLSSSFQFSCLLFIQSLNNYAQQGLSFSRICFLFI